MDFTADLLFMLEDAGGGATVTFGTSSTNCIYQSKSADAFGTRIDRVASLGLEKTALIKTGSLPGLKIDSRVTITAPQHGLFDVQFDVRNIEPGDEGATTRLFLKDV